MASPRSDQCVRARGDPRGHGGGAKKNTELESGKTDSRQKRRGKKKQKKKDHGKRPSPWHRVWISGPEVCRPWELHCGSMHHHVYPDFGFAPKRVKRALFLAISPSHLAAGGSSEAFAAVPCSNGTATKTSCPLFLLQHQLIPGRGGQPCDTVTTECGKVKAIELWTILRPPCRIRQERRERCHQSSLAAP